MKYGKRIAAFALAMTIALGSVCYRPPKAEALTGMESLFVSAACSSYMSCLGYSLEADNQQAINEAFAKQIATFCSDMYDAYNQTEEQFYGILQSGATIVKNGVIQLSHEACDVLKRFSDWLIDKFNLIGEDGTPVTEPVQVYELPPFAFSDGTPVVIPVHSWPFTPSFEDFPGTIFDVREPYSFSSGTTFTPLGVDSSGNYSLKIVRSDGDEDVFTIPNGAVYVAFYSSKADLTSYNGVLLFYSKDYSKAGDSTWYYLPSIFGGVQTGSVSVSLSPDYEAAPTVDEQYAMVIDTGMTFEDEQEMIDQVLGILPTGTYKPTYTVEQVTEGGVTVPGESEDTEDDTPAGILSWTKKIWQSVTELPDTIARAVAEVFVPSEEYMSALPDTITATFDDRTGFLTYPASVLYDFGDMLSKGAADFILEWPEIRVPPSNAVLLDDGSFNVSKFVRDNDDLSMVYELYQFVVSAYLTFLFLGLCRRKYNSVIGDRLEG